LESQIKTHCSPLLRGPHDLYTANIERLPHKGLIAILRKLNHSRDAIAMDAGRRLLWRRVLWSRLVYCRPRRSWGLVHHRRSEKQGGKLISHSIGHRLHSIAKRRVFSLVLTSRPIAPLGWPWKCDRLLQRSRWSPVIRC
jgi:hypothetical protein